MLDDPDFTPSVFFARAAARLVGNPPAPAAGELGDHVLNPGFIVDGATYRDAAVLIPVVAREPQATMLLTLRTAHLPAHAGQIAFPGGKIEADDESAAAAALREAEEEIGLAPRNVEIIGYLDPYLTGTGYRIVPVLGRVDPGHVLSLNPSEVVETFEVPLSFLMSPVNYRRGSREWQGEARYFYEIPFERHYIWGITAGIIRGLYERVFG